MHVEYSVPSNKNEFSINFYLLVSTPTIMSSGDKEAQIKALKDELMALEKERKSTEEKLKENRAILDTVSLMLN